MSLVTSGVEIRVENEAFDITRFVQALTWTESMLTGGWAWSLVLGTDDWKRWTALILGKDTPLHRLRIFSASNGVEATTDWKQVFVDTSRSSFRGKGMGIHIAGADKRLLMRQKARTRAWKNATAATIAQTIASEYDLNGRTEEMIGRRDCWQLREDDWSFVSRIARESCSSSGRGDVYLWLEEDRLNLLAPNYATPSARRHDVANIEGRVERIVLDYAGRQIDRLGGASTRAIAYDLNNAAASIFTVDSNQASTLPALARKVPRDPADALRVMPIAQEGMQFAEGMARATWGAAAPRYFTLRLDTRPDLNLRLGSTIEIQANESAKQQTPLLGKFVVLEIRHNYVRGELTTTVVCSRRDCYEGESDTTGSSAVNTGTADKYSSGGASFGKTILVAEVLD